MSEAVKPRRRYDSRRRQEQAAQTRRDIVTAAHQLFVERSYAGTTLAAVAKAAGVVVETIYRSFDGKAGLFKAVVEAAVAGGAARAERQPEDRPAIKAVIAETDPQRQLERYAATQPGIHARMGPLLRVLAEATAADPSLRELAQQLEDQRLDGMGRFAQLLADRGVLRPEVTIEEARDVLWMLNSHSVHDMLVVHRGWSSERYREWLTDALIRMLLPTELARRPTVRDNSPGPCE